MLSAEKILGKELLKVFVTGIIRDHNIIGLKCEFTLRFSEFFGRFLYFTFL